MIKRILSKFVIVFLVGLISANTLAIVLLIDQIKSMNYEFSNIYEKIEQYEVSVLREETLSEAKIIEFYKEINQKSNESINRILTIVGIVAGVVTFFSLLLAYKAPHDIDKRIDELSDLINKTKLSADEAKYQALISSAMAKPIPYEVIKKLGEIIRKYPDKPDAYVVRGFMYDEVKKYDFAITDYETAKKYGCELETYYNSMGVAYSNKNEHKKAINFYNKAIKIDSNASSYYCNRACSYDDIGEFQKALADYSKAIEIDSECYEAYFNRNFTYDQLWRIEKNQEKKKEYIQKRKEDLEKAIELNPQNGDALRLLKKFVGELLDKGILISKEEIIERNIAKFDEQIADISFESSDYKDAYDHYVDAFNYYCKQVFIEKKESYREDFNRAGYKIIRVIINANGKEDINNGNKLNPILVSTIASTAYNLYVSSEKKEAEILFKFILPDAGSALNLAFMKRRNETVMTEESAVELLELEKDKESAIWCINKALCLIDGVESDNDWLGAIEVLKRAATNVEDAIEFWSQIELVGSKENNVVFLLLALAGLRSDEKSITLRIAMAQNDGYVIPEELK